MTELKALLKSKRLPQDGSKAELVERLEQAEEVSTFTYSPLRQPSPPLLALMRPPFLRLCPSSRGGAHRFLRAPGTYADLYGG